ncbi:CMGC protein kinase [Penicillium capsulatum]|uniref:CMGC protein kinase n=1 Tax=Penicillium capsulatum TaxID=69766 RepID=A0A9W9LLJ1_9EURO|nr:CMGC protein kinase [Penicillium capsulatum]KAJ6116992.1 CMGC protein kinase [Penicillium capsulatum]
MDRARETRKMGSFRQITRRSLSSLTKSPFTLPPPKLISTPDRIGEERIPWYDSSGFYPAKPGDVLADRYQILVKVGWGSSSTVWLARDTRNGPDEEMLSTLKINTADNNTSERERELEQHTEKAASETTQGKHLYFVYEPMRETFSRFQTRFVNSVIPFHILKIYLMVLLQALDRLHTTCNVVHSDLKVNNIMISFEDPAVFGDFMTKQPEEPAEYKVDAAGRSIFRSRNEFGPLRPSWRSMVPRIIDFGSALQLHGETGRGLFPIQAPPYRAPEVTLGFPWNRGADIWSLGTLDMAQDSELFQQAYGANRMYDAESHLAEMIALLGPPPSSMIAESHATLARKFLHDHLIPDRRIEDTLPLLEDEAKKELLAFAKRMLVWDHEERATARELLEDPFMKL